MANELFEFLDGKQYNLDGISGSFRYVRHEAHYPYLHWVDKLWHSPDEVGQQTEQYRHIKQELGDDWDTDLTSNIERFCNIALELGWLA